MIDLSERAKAVLENIASRRSVRSYEDRAVPAGMVELLLRAAMAAPSAKNRQPWEFVVVDDRATLDALAGRLRYAKMLTGAPLAVIVCARTVIGHSENLLLAAEALGLGAVWTAASDPERSEAVKSVIPMPDDIMPLCVVPIGFPAGAEQPKDKWNPGKIHHNRW